MNLDAYIEALQALVAAHPPDLGDEDSVLSLMYEAHGESNAMYGEEIKADFHALYETMNGMPLREMDQIVYPVCTLCRSHQKSGFIEGVRVGFALSNEITCNNLLEKEENR